MSNQETVEQQIQRLGATTAPRITPAAIEANIVSAHYFTALQGARMAALDAADDMGDVRHLGQPHAPELGLLTICVLVLRNGFTVVGKAGVASPENFNAEIGRRVAREDAVDQLWPLMGYALRDEIARDRWAQHIAMEAAAHRAENPPPFGGVPGSLVAGCPHDADSRALDNLGAHEQRAPLEDSDTAGFGSEEYKLARVVSPTPTPTPPEPVPEPPK